MGIVIAIQVIAQDSVNILQENNGASPEELTFASKWSVGIGYTIGGIPAIPWFFGENCMISFTNYITPNSTFFAKAIYFINTHHSVELKTGYMFASFSDASCPVMEFTYDSIWSREPDFKLQAVPLMFNIFKIFPKPKSNLQIGIGPEYYLAKGIQYFPLVDKNTLELTGENFIITNWMQGWGGNFIFGYERLMSPKFILCSSLTLKISGVKEFKNDAPAYVKREPIILGLWGLYLDIGVRYNL